MGKPPFGLRDVKTALALSFWVLALLFVFLWEAATLLLLPVFPAAAVTSAAVLVALAAAPLTSRPPRWASAFMDFSLTAAKSYFPVEVVYEDRAALRAGRPYVVGFEPHSVLPLGMVVLSHVSPEVFDAPPGLQNTRLLVSSTGLWTPVMRHFWWWFGCRPASRPTVHALLSKGRSVVLCPGGVRECLFMQPGRETVYLTRRHGFVRVALQHGAPLVPVFAFGQSAQFSYLRPFIDWPRGVVPRGAWGRLVRKIGFVPMLAWGRRGTPMPRAARMTVVVGAPLEVPRLASPPPEVVDEHLQRYIAATRTLFERHKAAAGHGGDLVVI